MKRIGNLYDKIISLDNLRLADSKARRGKSNSYGVELHDRNREANLLALHEALITRTFKTSAYNVFTIYEPKERLIYRLPYYPDRILHHAIMNIIEPIWLSVFPYNTYSCIKGRGIHGAMKQVKRILRDPEQSRYCLKIDIRKFYPSIDHQVAKRLIRKRIKCPDTLRLLDEIIDSVNGTIDPLDPTKVCQGHSLPIGNYPSQYLANLILSYMMHRINERKGIRSVLYADDGCFFAATKDELHSLLDYIRTYLRDELSLTLKDNWQIFPVAKNRYDRHGRGVDFVGYVFYHEQTAMRKSVKQNYCRAIAKLNKRMPEPTPKAYKMEIAPWLGWAKYSNSRHLLKTTIKPKYYDTL